MFFSLDTEKQYWTEKIISMTICLYTRPDQAKIDNMLEGYKIKSALPYKIFLTLFTNAKTLKKNGCCSVFNFSQILLA